MEGEPVGLVLLSGVISDGGALDKAHLATEMLDELLS